MKLLFRPFNRPKLPSFIYFIYSSDKTQKKKQKVQGRPLKSGHMKASLSAFSYPVSGNKAAYYPAARGIPPSTPTEAQLTNVTSPSKEPGVIFQADKLV